jgi:hypothetical protein
MYPEPQPAEYGFKHTTQKTAVFDRPGTRDMSFQIWKTEPDSPGQTINKDVCVEMLTKGQGSSDEFFGPCWYKQKNGKILCWLGVGWRGGRKTGLEG